MGFNGDVVVYRGTAPLQDFDSTVDTEMHPVRGEWAGREGWRVVHVRHFDIPYEYEEPWISALHAKTAAPVMSCNVFESDVARVRGVSPAGAWDGWLDPRSAAGRLADDRIMALMDANEESGFEPEDETAYLSGHYARLREEADAQLTAQRPLVAAAVVRWAADAGFTVSREPVADLLERGRDPFVQVLFFDLLRLIGVTPPR